MKTESNIAFLIKTLAIILITITSLTTLCTNVRGADHVPENLLIIGPSGGVSDERNNIATRNILTGSLGYTINPGARLALHAPTITLSPGFRANSGSQVVMGIPAIYLHFVVVAPDADFPDHDGLTSTCGDPDGCCPKNPGRHCIVDQDIFWLVNSINERLISEDGERIFDFRVANITTYDELTADDKNDPLYESITNTDASGSWLGNKYNGRLNETNFDNCTSSRLCNHRAINVYIYENRYDGEGGFGATDDTGHGRNNGHEPFILVDFDRVTGVDGTTGAPIVRQLPFEHELGHAFNLGHTCEDGVNISSDPSFLMGSGYYCGELDNIYYKVGTDDEYFISCMDSHTLAYCNCLLVDSIADCNDLHSVNDVGDNGILHDYYCPSLVGHSGGERAEGVPYDSLLNCPTSSQRWWKDTTNNDTNDRAQGLSQMEIMYWNSMLIQDNLRPEFPF